MHTIFLNVFTQIADFDRITGMMMMMMMMMVIIIIIHIN